MGDWKKFIRVGSFFAAATAILGGTFTAISYAKPLIESDWPGPFVNADRVTKSVAECDGKIQLMAQNFNLMQQHIERSDTNQLFLAQGFWILRVAELRVKVKKNPDDVQAQADLLAAERELKKIEGLLARQ